MSRQSILEILRGVEALKCLDPSALEALAESCRLRTYEAGQVVVRRGDIATCAFVHVSGAICNELPGIGNVRTGDLFGEIGAFTSHAHHRTATLITSTPVEIIEIPYDALSGLLELMPVFYDRVCRYLAECAAAAETRQRYVQREAHAARLDA